MNRTSDKLRSKHVHVGGCGRIGTAVVLALHAAGIGTISCNDPQTVEEEQLGPCVLFRRSDLGRPKVHVLERTLDGRPGIEFIPIVARNQSARITSYLETADLIVSCANRLDARLHLERQAIRLGKPIIQAGVEDARISLGGTITLWHPAANCSCFGCLLSKNHRALGNEVLVASVTGTIADFAAHFSVRLLESTATEFARKHNVFLFDLQNMAMEALSVTARGLCRICKS